MGLLPIAFVNVFTERWSSATCIVRMALYEAEMALSDWSKSFEQYVGENVARQGLILLFSSESILLTEYSASLRASVVVEKVTPNGFSLSNTCLPQTKRIPVFSAAVTKLLVCLAVPGSRREV